MAHPALSAMVVFPETLETQFGIRAKIAGLNISGIAPVHEAEHFELTDEDTNPDVHIVHSRKFSFEFTAVKLSRDVDIARAYPGAMVTEASFSSWMDPDYLQNQPTAFEPVSHFIFRDPKVGLKKAEPDEYTFSLLRFGGKLPRFEA